MEYFLLFLCGVGIGRMISFGISCLCTKNKNDKGE